MPRLPNAGVSAVAIPHLAIGEHHHLVHELLVFDEPVDDFVSIGGVTHLLFTTVQFHRVGKDAVHRQVYRLPSIAEQTANDLRAMVFQQHSQHQADVVKFHLATRANALFHRAGNIAGQQHLGVGTKAFNIGCRAESCRFQSRKHICRRSRDDSLHFTIGSQIAEGQLLGVGHSLGVA